MVLILVLVRTIGAGRLSRGDEPSSMLLVV
jgi:hypothetical protein